MTIENKPISNTVTLAPMKFRTDLFDGSIDREKYALWISMGVAVAAFIGIIFYLYLARQTDAWQHYVLGVMTIVLLIAAFACILFVRKGMTNTGIWFLLIVGQICVVISPLLTARQGILYGAGIMLSTLIITTLTMTGREASLANITGVIAGLTAILLDTFFPTYQVEPAYPLLYFIPAVVGILALIYIYILGRFFYNFNIRTKITIAAFSAALVSITILALVNNFVVRGALTEANNQTLLLAAKQTASNIDEYLSIKSDSMNSYMLSPVITQFIDSSDNALEERTVVVDYLEVFMALEGALSYALMDRDGNVLLHSEVDDIGKIPQYLGLERIDEGFFELSLLTGLPYISPALFSDNESEPHYYIGARLLNINQEPAGMLIASYPMSEIQSIVARSNELAGKQSYAELIQDSTFRIANGLDPDARYTLLFQMDDTDINAMKEIGRLPDVKNEQLITKFSKFKQGMESAYVQPFFTSLIMGDDDGEYAIAAANLENYRWSVAYMQPLSVLLAPIQQLTRATILITVLIAALTVVGAVVFTQGITNPITDLTRTATEIAAGNLEVRTKVDSRDEIGTLSTAINMMTIRLKETLDGLERRVEERTTELESTTSLMESRANRLQIVADIAHDIAKVQDPDELLPLVTQTISEKFGYYHVGVFLVDRNAEFAVLHAANSEGGKRMVESGHRLKIGEVGIIGYVTNTGDARIALDVGSDATYIDNPYLPKTRSEIGLPLIIGDKIIGALDVQSTEPEVFTQDDIALLSTLADQVAMSIENARLFQDIQLAFSELQYAQRQYLEQEWTRIVSERHHDGYVYNFGKINAEENIGFDLWQSLEEGEPMIMTRSSEKDNGRASDETCEDLVVPISLRGQVIGMIQLEGEKHEWTADEISMAQSVADQVGLALENARLLHETLIRAERERKVSDITSKLRSTNDPQIIINTAISELQNALQTNQVKFFIESEAEMEDGEKTKVQVGIEKD
jgi:GAF domain-containing protein/HAMP domain-containing protein